MKNLFTKILFLIWGITSAQCVTNGTLDATSIGNNGITSIQGWQGTHGTPSSSGIVNSNTWVWMWSHSGGGEGIFTNYNFVQGKTYQISFDIKTSTNISNPNTTVLNSFVYIKALNNLSQNSGISTLLNNGQIVLQSTIATYRSSNWITVTVNFIPNQNYTQLSFFPYMAANSSTNGSAQVQMEIDNISIIPPVTSVFHFEDSNNNMKTDFCEGENIFLDGTASFGENQYYLDVWRRPIGSTGTFQWQIRKGANGWTSGQLGVLNLSSIFNGQGYNFISGYEYEVKVATASTPCVGWVPTTHIFRVLSSNASSLFTFNSFCAPNGTISVTVTANDTSAGVNHWWGLIESSVAGSTTDANSLGLVGSIQSGTTTTFTGLSKDNNYYIKHGVYNSCVSWRETRTALPQTAGWSGYTNYFNFTQQNSNGTNVTVQVTAASNSVFVNHHWSISYAPNGSTAIEYPVGVLPSVSPNGMIATFNSGLVINTWYYIKHGIWNDCAPWGETRRAFRVVFLGRLANGEPNYAVETKDVKEVEVISENISKKIDNNSIIEQLSPNPITKGNYCNFTTDSKNVSEVILIDLLGKSSPVSFSIKDENTINFPINERLAKGIYIIKVIKKDNTISTKKLIVE